jgi:hypothetical protein
MLMAASVISSVRSYDGVSMMKTWEMRRAVRKPVSRCMAAFISSSVCRLPFIMACIAPDRQTATPISAAFASDSASSTG